MDTIHSWMISRIPNFISVSPLTILSRWSINSTEVLAFTRITGSFYIYKNHGHFIEIIFELLEFHYLTINWISRHGLFIYCLPSTFPWTYFPLKPQKLYNFLKDRTILYRCKNKHKWRLSCKGPIYQWCTPQVLATDALTWIILGSLNVFALPSKL